MKEPSSLSNITFITKPVHLDLCREVGYDLSVGSSDLNVSTYTHRNPSQMSIFEIADFRRMSGPGVLAEFALHKSGQVSVVWLCSARDGNVYLSPPPDNNELAIIDAAEEKYHEITRLVETDIDKSEYGDFSDE